MHTAHCKQQPTHRTLYMRRDVALCLVSFRTGMNLQLAAKTPQRNCTMYNVYWMLYNLCCTLYTSLLYMVHFNTSHCTILHCTLYTVHFNTSHCTILHCTLYNSILHTVQFYTSHCTILYCTLYTYEGHTLPC